MSEKKSRTSAVIKADFDAKYGNAISNAYQFHKKHHGAHQEAHLQALWDEAGGESNSIVTLFELKIAIAIIGEIERVYEQGNGLAYRQLCFDKLYRSVYKAIYKRLLQIYEELTRPEWDSYRLTDEIESTKPTEAFGSEMLITIITGCFKAMRIDMLEKNHEYGPDIKCSA